MSLFGLTIYLLMAHIGLVSSEYQIKNASDVGCMSASPCQSKTAYQWTIYPTHEIYQFLEGCRWDCKSVRSVQIMMLRYIRYRLKSLKYINDMCMMNNHENFFWNPIIQNVNRAYLGIIRYYGNCKVSWLIQVSHVFSINLTINYLQFKLQGHICPSCERYYEVPEKPYSHMKINQEKPVFKELAVLQGHPLPGSLLISGHIASISLFMAFHRNHVLLDCIFQAMLKQPDEHIWNDTENIKHKGQIGGMQYFIKKKNMPSRSVDILQKTSSKQNVVLWTITVNLVWKVVISVQVTCSSNTTPVYGTFVDGLIPPYRNLVHFNNSESIYCVQYNTSNWSTTTSLNHASLIVEMSHFNTGRIQVQFEAVKDKCPSSTCYITLTKIHSGMSLDQRINQDSTVISNNTYYMDPDNDKQMSLRVTSLSIQGHYIPSCPYGSVTLAYKENIHQSHHIILGTYCSPGTVNGLLEIASPLYLAKGSLSIIVKSYMYITKIKMLFTISTDSCKGIVDEYFVVRYSMKYRPAEQNDTLPHYRVSDPIPGYGAVDGSYFFPSKHIQRYIMRD